MLELRNYQKRSLEALEEYLKNCVKLDSGDIAFYKLTKIPYNNVKQLPEGLPYVCLRVPTGGGKTLMACHAVGIAAKHLLHREQALCLWLVPSNAIREQTLKALRNRQHPYRQAVQSIFSGSVAIFDIAEALYIQQGTISRETCIIVSTLAALRVEDTDGRKVYESAGALEHHFSAIPAVLKENLEKNSAGAINYSLANLIKMYRPVVIMDEAHNARTPLSFDTLARLNPSCIIEFTATPETNNDLANEKFASNVLYHVSAAELKSEDMIKLPIRLRTRTSWKDAVGEAVRAQRQLEKIALAEERATGEYLRPIVLLQAQPRSQTRQTITVEVLRQCLIEDFKIPEEQIAKATNEDREIEGVDLNDRDCKKRFIITVQALKEGWDCPFAYILCSVSETSTATAVEQILGRILRLPKARKKKHDELNSSYAFVASKGFYEAATSLKDALLENGFNKFEVEKFVRAEGSDEQHELFMSESFLEEMRETVNETPDFSKLPESLSARVTYDEGKGALVVAGQINEQEKEYITECFKSDSAKQAIEKIYEKSKRKMIQDDSPASQGIKFSVPALSIRSNGELELFEEHHFHDFEWQLDQADVSIAETDFPQNQVTGEEGELDVVGDRIEIHYLAELHQQLAMLNTESGWTQPSLVNWLDRQIYHPDITRTQATLYINCILKYLIEQRGILLEELATRKYPLRDLITEKINIHRKAQKKECYNKCLFEMGAVELEVNPEICISFEEGKYAPNWYYEGSFKLPRHFYPVIGELKSEGEEFECARFIAHWDAVEYWVRNLERRQDSSFWLQTSTDRFYPDFVVKLKDGRILIVEYKGAHLWDSDDSKEKRAVGELWADRSNGKCLFIMPKSKDLKAIEVLISA